jgi:N-acylneuraminate cytidylyltransferase
MRLAVIPARGGSKRIPRKNVKPFCGKPIIAWPIEAALRAGCFDDVIVSTDDLEIARIAEQHGANIPFLRPPALANDFVGTIPVVRHATEWFQQNGKAPDQVCCIYATAPFLHESDLLRGLDLLQVHKCSYAFSVTSYQYPIQRAIRITEQGRVEMLHPEHLNTRSQDLEETMHDAAQFYWGQAQAWLDERAIFASTSVPVFVSRQLVQDIDTLEDWALAEKMFAVNK